MHLSHRTIAILIAALAGLAIACTTEGDSIFPTAEPAATSTPVPIADGDEHDDDDGHEDDEADHDEVDEDLVAVGREVFANVGCATCHGVDGVGTDIAPAMPGHNEIEIRRQVRGPIGTMPLFDKDLLSSTDLDALVAYVTNLVASGGHADDGHSDEGHGSGANTAEESLAHHRMTLLALQSGNTVQARHHMEVLLEILGGQHLALMQEAVKQLDADNTDEAEHMVAGMLVDVLPQGELNTLSVLNLRQALASVRIGDTALALHNLGHVLEGPDSHDQEEATLAIIANLNAGDLESAEVGLSELLGQDPIGVDTHEDDGHADEADDGHADEADDGHADEADDGHADEEGDDHADETVDDGHADEEGDDGHADEEGDNHAEGEEPAA